MSGCVEGHFLCFMCYDELMAVEDEPRCPSCRTFVHPACFMRNRMLDTLVGRAIVACQRFNSSVMSNRARCQAGGASSCNGAVAENDASMIVEVDAAAGLTNIVSYSSNPSNISNMSIAALRRELSIDDDTVYISMTELQKMVIAWRKDGGQPSSNSVRFMSITALRRELSIDDDEGPIPLTELQNMVIAWRKDGEVALCRWAGRMSDLKAHLDQRCRTTTIPCPFPGCGGEPLVKNAAAHSLVCGNRQIVCEHCGGYYKAAVLVEHFTKCPHKIVVCPNEGCNERAERGIMNVHRLGCAYEVVQCPCQPCDQVRLRRQDMPDHLVRLHASEHMAARVQIAEMQARLDTFESMQMLRLPTTTIKVFNWVVPTGFQPCKNESETFDFGNGYSASAIIRASDFDHPQDQLFIGFCLYPPPDVRMFGVSDATDEFVVTFAIVDCGNHDIVEIAKFGSPLIAHEHDFSEDRYFGVHFEVSQYLRRTCERGDGSIRGHVTLEIFP